MKKFHYRFPSLKNRVISFVLTFLYLCFFNCAYSQSHIEVDVVQFVKNTSSSRDQTWPKQLIVRSVASRVSFLSKNLFFEIKRAFSNDLFVIEVKKPLPDSIAASMNIIGEANFLWKLFGTDIFKNARIDSFSIKKFVIYYANRRGLDSIINITPLELKIESEFGSANMMMIACNYQSLVSKILPLPGVLGVQFRKHRPSPESPLLEFDSALNSIHLAHRIYPHLNGTGLTVSVKEDRFNFDDIDFRGRVVQSGRASSSTTSHATNVATLIAGGGNSSAYSTGIAPGSMLVSHSFDNLFPDTTEYKTHNVQVQNHSYGVGIENFYGVDAMAYDKAIIDNPQLIHVFSSGNEGNSIAIGSIYNGIKGFATITGSFKMSKNSIAVGAQNRIGDLIPQSSQGPTYDGRIKPEIVAFGVNGSSEAAAIVSGTILLMQDAFKRKHSDSLPTNALVKAILCNSSSDMNKPGPDYQSGYGSLNAYKAISQIYNDNFLLNSVALNQTKTFSVLVPDNVSEFKVSLAWDDPPALPFTLKALINDLDIDILDPENNRWLPWVLSTAPFVDSLNTIAHTGIDSVNVVEQVSIYNPKPGYYTIRVKGKSVQTIEQAFAIAYHSTPRINFRWIFPVKSDLLLAGRVAYLRWASSYPAQSKGSISMSDDNGLSWREIANNIDLSTSNYPFFIPESSSKVLFKMEIDGAGFLSDPVFSVLTLQPKLIYDCEDSLMLSWTHLRGVNEYAVYILRDKYMEEVATTSDSFYVFPKNNLTLDYLSVSSIVGLNIRGGRGLTIEKNAQGVGCFIKSFLADLILDNKVELSLSLSTSIPFSTVVFEKLIDGRWTSINRIPGRSNSIFSFLDNSLHKGYNIYRSRIELSNQKIIYSDQVAVFFLGKSDFVVFPNPVQRNESLSIRAKDPFNKVLIIQDSRGQKVFEQSMQSELHVTQLNRGIYIINIYQKKNRLFTQKIIVY